MIVTLPNLESAKKALFSLQGKDIKFIKPSQPSMWDAKIIECAFVCKILKTLSSRFKDEHKDYLFTYRSKIFYNVTTFNIKYNKDTYGFEVNTGLSFGNGIFEIKNENFDLSEAAEILLDALIIAAKKELPQTKYDFLVKRCNEIKSLKEY